MGTTVAPDEAWLPGWLQRTVPDAPTPITVERVGVGQSNLTYRVTDGAGVARILRRPPDVDHAAGAHDVLREARVLRALDGTPVPVPRVLAVERDFTDGGRAFSFYLMNAVPGRVIETVPDAESLRHDERKSLGSQLATVLATIHAVDPAAVGLGDLGRGSDFVARQLRRNERNWDSWGRSSPHDAAWAAVAARLRAAVPVQRHTVLTHGDLRLANVLVHDGAITAVLDWELATLGDPLADLAWLLDDWRGPEEPAIAIPSPTQAGGFPDRDEIAGEYARLTGFDLSGLSYYRAFTHWKAASLLQGVATRRRAGVYGAHGALDLDDIDRTIAFLLAGAGDLLDLG